MASDKNTDLTQTIDRILRERLDQFDVPSEVRTELRREILAFFQRPEQKPFGAAVMTPEASIAADQARKEGRTQGPGGNTPKII
jgi:hypothetical protein